MLTRIIDINAIRNNIANARAASGSGVLLVAKADAYGAGMEITRSLERYVDGFAVARASEGARLRRLGIEKQILALSYSDGQLDDCGKYGLIPCISTAEQAALIGRGAVDSVHIAVDTGMNRYGVKSTEELNAVVDNLNNAKISGLFTHIWHNGTENASYQAAKFDEYDAHLSNLTDCDYKTHVSASGSVDKFYNRYDFVRLGLSAYRNANYLVSEVLLTKRVKKGESIGYDGLCIAENDMSVAIVEGGYADGIPRQYRGNNVVVNGILRPVIGNVCMDALFVDVTGIKCRAGDRVVVLDNDNIQLSDLAKGFDKTEYEVLTGLHGRCNKIIFT